MFDSGLLMLLFDGVGIVIVVGLWFCIELVVDVVVVEVEVLGVFVLLFDDLDG